MLFFFFLKKYFFSKRWNADDEDEDIRIFRNRKTEEQEQREALDRIPTICNADEFSAIIANNGAINNYNMKVVRDDNWKSLEKELEWI